MDKKVKDQKSTHIHTHTHPQTCIQTLKGTLFFIQENIIYIYIYVYGVETCNFQFPGNTEQIVKKRL